MTIFQAFGEYPLVPAFLVFILLLGLWAGRNVKTFKDYATANGSLHVAVITLSLLATFLCNRLFLYNICYTSAYRVECGSMVW